MQHSFKRLGISSLFAAGLVGLVSSGAQAATVLIDFGDSATPTNVVDALARSWNNVTQANDVSGTFTLNNSGGTDSNYRLAISNPAGVTNAVGFNAANTNGTLTPTGTALARNYPASATRDTLYGNTVSFNGLVVQAVRLTLSNLDPAEVYNLDFFAARIGAGGDNREGEYHIVGGNTNQSIFLNAAENTGNIVGLAGISPDANNQIVIDVDPGPNNTNANKFFYLGVMEINSSPATTPEPGSIALLGVGAVALLGRKRRIAV